MRDGDTAILFKCHAGCTSDQIVAALKTRGMAPGNSKDHGHVPWEPPAPPEKPRVVKTWPYTATDGTQLRKRRWEPGFPPGKNKSFDWQHEADGRWLPGQNGKIPRLYRCENIEAAGPNDIILIAECTAPGFSDTRQR